MKLKLTLALNSEMRVLRKFKNTFTTYTKTNLLEKRLVLLPIDWDTNGLVLIKRLHMMNKIILFIRKDQYEQYLAL